MSPRVAETQEEKQDALDEAQEAFAEIEVMVEGGDLTTSSKLYLMVQEALDAAKKKLEQHFAKEYRETEENYTKEVAWPIAKRAFETLIAELQVATEDKLSEEFWEARVAGRHIEMRCAVDGTEFGFKLVNARERKPRSFRLTSISGNFAPGVDLVGRVWLNKKLFLEELCSTRNVDGELRIFSPDGAYQCNTRGEMWSYLERSFKLEVEHIEVKDDDDDED